jgi:hemerythrin
MDEYISWTPDLAVHVDTIDEQHQQLYRKMNDVIVATLKGEGKQEIGNFVGFLRDYTIVHFRDEEDLMTRHAYPGLDAQKKAHQYFTEEVDQMVSQVHAGEVDSQMVSAVITKLGDWFSNHIRSMDKQLGQFMKDKG